MERKERVEIVTLSTTAKEKGAVGKKTGQTRWDDSSMNVEPAKSDVAADHNINAIPQDTNGELQLNGFWSWFQAKRLKMEKKGEMPQQEPKTDDKESENPAGPWSRLSMAKLSCKKVVSS
jgi:hypothetical protein